MLTGKRVAAATLASCLALSAACRNRDEPPVDHSAPATAWWYDIRFEPGASTVRGIDLQAFDAGWRRGDALDASDLAGRVSRDDMDRFAASPFSFSLTTDLDGDAVPELLFVGVFEADDGTKGRFVAITRGRHLVHHFEERGANGFSALLQVGDDVRWYKCMECGEYESITRFGDTYVLE